MVCRNIRFHILIIREKRSVCVLFKDNRMVFHSEVAGPIEVALDERSRTVASYKGNKMFIFYWIVLFRPFIGIC